MVGVDHCEAASIARGQVEAAKEARRVGGRYDDTLARAYLDLLQRRQQG